SRAGYVTASRPRPALESDLRRRFIIPSHTGFRADHFVRRSVLMLAAPLAAVLLHCAVADADDAMTLCRPWTQTTCLLGVTGSLKSVSGTPLPGKTLKFFVGDVLLCSAVTDDSGRASCRAPVEDGLVALTSQRQIVFDGDALFDAAASVAEP